MNLPFRRRSRPRGTARLALAGDFPGTGESVTEILDRVRPAGYDGTTIEVSGASGAGLPPGAIYGPAPAGPAAGPPPGAHYGPAPAGPDDAVTPEWWRP